MKRKFLRRSWDRYSKLGKRRKKKQVWRRPTGRHNKMREKRKGKPATVSIGYRTNKKNRGLINNMVPKTVYNLKDLENLKNNQMIILGDVGKKRKIELLKEIVKKNIKVYNINPKKFLKKYEKLSKVDKK